MFSSNLALIISFLPISLTNNKKLDVFHKYLKPTLTKLSENDPDNWDKYINQVLASYHVISFFLVYRRDPNLPSTNC